MNDPYDNAITDREMLRRHRPAPAMTPAEHRAKAEDDLAALWSLDPASPGYHGHVLSAIAHVLAAVAEYLEPPPEQDIPGLPEGWRVTTAQSEKGNRLWGYVLTGPGTGTEHSPYRWGSSASALMAGLRYAGTVPEKSPEPGPPRWIPQPEPAPQD